MEAVKGTRLGGAVEVAGAAEGVEEVEGVEGAEEIAVARSSLTKAEHGYSSHTSCQSKGWRRLRRTFCQMGATAAAVEVAVEAVVMAVIAIDERDSEPRVKSQLAVTHVRDGLEHRVCRLVTTHR